jgi:hypothetical protein
VGKQLSNVDISAAWTWHSNKPHASSAIIWLGIRFAIRRLGYLEVDNFSDESADGSSRRRLRDSLGGAFEKMLSEGVAEDAGT